MDHSEALSTSPITRLRRRAEEQPPASLGLSYFREDR